MQYRGSKWRKWDLHVHTPISIHQEYGGDTDTAWDKYVNQLEELTQPYSVIGVNDYFTIEGYKKLNNFKIKGRLGKAVLFPVIELRVRTFGSLGADDPWKRVNLHVIFDNQNVEKIETQFLNLLKFDYTNFNRVGLTRENIIDFGNSVINGIPENKRIGDSPLSAGFNNLNFDHREICKLLEESGLNYLIAIGKAEWDALRWDASIAEKKDIVERSHLMFTAAADVNAHKKGETKLKTEGIGIPLLDCSDAHTFSDKKDSNDNLIKDRLGNCFTWIKADKTFEGLKQIIYEPQCRLFISDHQPVLPPRRIDTLHINFPSDTIISRKDDKSIDKSADFCLRGNHEIHFSPFFTCLIGGRGAGKSTILNIIAKKLGQDDSFFETNILRSFLGGGDLKEIKELETYIEIDYTSEIEYISQNEIEDFAKDKEKLTNAIYTRLAQISEVDFKPNEAKIEKNILEVTKQLKDVNNRHEKKAELLNAETSLVNDQKIVSSFNNPTYAAITNEINKVGEEIERINIAKLKYSELLFSVSELVEKYDFTSLEANNIEKEIEKVVEGLKKIIAARIDTSIIDADLTSLTKKQIDLTNQLEDYLKSQGLSQENINDYERATKAIPQYRTTISALNAEIKEIEKSLQAFEESRKSFFQDKRSLEKLIDENLEPLNTKLKSDNPNVKDISFKYDFDYEKAKEALFQEFWNYFENKRPKDFALNSPSDAVNRYLFENDPIKVLEQSKAEFISRYELKGKSAKEETQAKQYLLKLFEDDVNFEIYKLLILRVCINPLKYKVITGFYDNRELRSCSFGQRCTAVIVALLTFGNKPLIIDEPEAHLDSKLIAEYLVGLVKRRKQERQIIFATHNANFVINGDAELILHLEVGENNETEITPVSIENITHREKLLLLEGGEEAFRKRDKRLISN
jgi:exonuclease SbcC